MKKYCAPNGEDGGKNRCHGADGEDLIIKVPEGTVIRDFTRESLRTSYGMVLQDTLLRSGTIRANITMG